MKELTGRIIRNFEIEYIEKKLTRFSRLDYLAKKINEFFAERKT